MNRCPVLAACIVAGYDPSKTVTRDFRRPADYVVPVRKPRKPRSGTPQTRIQWEGVCVQCEGPFSRRVRPADPEPLVCSVSCAAALRWQRDHAKAFGKRVRGPLRFGRVFLPRRS